MSHYIVCCCSSSCGHPRLLFSHVSPPDPPPARFIHHEICYIYSFLLFSFYSWKNFPSHFITFFFFLLSFVIFLTPFSLFHSISVSFLGYVPSLSVSLLFYYFSPSSQFRQKFGIFYDFRCYEFM